MKTIWLTGTLSLILTLGSCVSTNVIEPDTIENKKGDEIVLHLSAPVEAQTRASESDFTLRYVAKLIPYIGQTLDYENMKREEALEEGSDIKMVFKDTKKDTKYLIIVFADYIKNSTPDENGYYEDYAYDTNVQSNNDPNLTPTRFFVKPTPGSTSTALSPEFFNNDFYDCFAGSITKTKEESSLEVNITLKRAVAKVEFIDTSEEPGTLTEINFADFEYKSGMEIRDMAITGSTIENNFKITPEEWFKDPSADNADYVETVSNKTEIPVFYFYTFANDTSSDKLTLGFTTSIEENDKTVTLETQTIPIQQNRKTKVRGNILPQDTTESQDPSTSKGDDQIIVIPNISDDWGADKEEDLE